MRLSQSTHLQMCLSLEILTSIIRTGLPILVELIDLGNSVTIFLSQMTLHNSHSPTLLDLFLSSDVSICFIMNFSLLENSDHVLVSVSIDFQSYLQRMPHFIALLMTILMLIRTVFVIILEMFHGRISLSRELLLLLMNFVSVLRLELMHISLIESIRSTLTHPHGSQLLVLLQ